MLGLESRFVRGAMSRGRGYSQQAVSGPIPSTTDDIGAFMVDHAYGAVAIEATPEHYLYKEPRNRYAFAIGEREFVEALVPGSMDECRVRLMEWIESVKLTRGERKVIEDEVFAYVAQP